MTVKATDDKSTETPGTGDTNETNNVSYEAHRKLLNEKKETEQKLKAFQDAEAKTKLEKEIEKGNYQTALKANEDALKAAAQERDTYKTRFESTVKASALSSAMKEMGLDFANEKAASFVDTSSLVLNDDGTIDKAQLKAFINQVNKDSSFLFKPTATTGKIEDKKHDNTGSQGGAGKASIKDIAALFNTKK